VEQHNVEDCARGFGGGRLIASEDGDKHSGPQWLRWNKRLQAIAQDGLTYTKDDYDLGRYEQLRELAAEMLAAHSTGTLEQASDLLALERGPATPKVDVRAAVFRKGRILLVKEPGDEGWSLPGGWADVGESPSEAAARETLEESGYRVRPVRLLAAYTSTSWCSCARFWMSPRHPTSIPTERNSSASRSSPSFLSPVSSRPRSNGSSSTTVTRTSPLTSTSARTVNPWARAGSPFVLSYPAGR
jgi:Hydrolase of X-linked nucleoside diphosphate N terminal/NUDIX domain